MAFTFGTLRANDLIWRYVVDNYLKGATPDAFDLLFWDSDSVSLPGPMYCWYTRNTYLENNIKDPGKTTRCGIPVDLSKIEAPVYLLASREDHIVPWKTAYLTKNLMGGDARFVLAASGHVAGVINPPARGIERCRTVALGGHVARCEDCAHTVIAYNSCLMVKSINGELATT